MEEELQLETAKEKSQLEMAEVDSESYNFLHFSQRKDTGLLVFDKLSENMVIQPKHPTTNEVDKYYLQSMLLIHQETSNEDCGWFNEILDAFPVLSLTTDENDKFYKLSIARLREFSCGRIEQDKYIDASIKHLYMENKIDTNKDMQLLLDECLKKAIPIMYAKSTDDAADCEDYELSQIASYVPTSIYSRMKLLKGWIEGALHYYNYSIMFFDTRFVGYDDFNENIIDVKSEDLRNSGSEFLLWSSEDYFFFTESNLYYKLSLRIDNLKRNWLLTTPNNDNERDGKVMLFRNRELKIIMEQILGTIFNDKSFRVNDVFKWNLYNRGGMFKTHFDTMFVSQTSEECSLYSLLVYLDVEKEDNFLYLGEEELKVQLESDTVYVIPHWVKHRVEGTGMRQFIKTEIVFKNKDAGITYDQTIADIFDQSCYYMLQSVRHPELKSFVSQNFNTLNEARFYKELYVGTLIDHIFILKEFSLPLKYSKTNGQCISVDKFKISFITDGNYYYFKTKTSDNVNRCEATLMLSMMHLDIRPRKLFSRRIELCTSAHPECEEMFSITADIDVKETIFYWDQTHAVTNMEQKLESISLPETVYDIECIGNTSIPDLKKDNKTFYFAAFEDSHDVEVFYQSRLTEITSKIQDGDYSGLNVASIGPQKNIVKIRQSSFSNGIKVKQIWDKMEVGEDSQIDFNNQQQMNDLRDEIRYNLENDNNGYIEDDEDVEELSRLYDQLS